KNPGCWLTRFLRFISMATRADSKWIYHNPLLYAPLKRVQRDHGSRQVKMATNHPKNCRDRA
ncbi:hypothetical protein ACVTMZ_25525, partial [Escherichia coli]